MDCNDICRVCLQRNPLAFDIFTCFCWEKNIVYADMLSYCTKIVPSENDGLPRNICGDCSRHLKQAYSFIAQYIVNDKKLKDILTTSVIERNNCPIEKVVQSYENDCIKSELVSQASDSIIAIEKEEDDEFKSEITSDFECTDEFILPTDVKKEIEGDGNEDELVQKKRGRKRKDNKRSHTFFDRSKALSSKSNDKDDACNGNIDIEKFVADNSDNSNVIKGDDVNVERVKKKRGRKAKEVNKSVNGNIVCNNEPVSSLKAKTVSEASRNRVPQQCEECGKVLSSMSNLTTHKICHTNLRRYKCSECPAAFKGHSGLVQHRTLHTGEKPYHCEYCSKQFRRKPALINHIRMHMGEKLYSCKICSKRFVQSSQMFVHMKRHSGIKSYLCQECGKGFYIKADLQVHQRIHSGEKPYSCYLCSKTFATSGNLSIHIRIHNKEVRYKCKFCGRGFVTCSAFNVHVKRHKGQKDYQCECGKSFFTSSALKQHRLVHSGERRYQCKICERKFTQTSHLNRHFRREHSAPGAPLPAAHLYKVTLPSAGVSTILAKLPGLT
ncbi:zinc finger protein ZFP2-like isoform X2 [Leptidea sinapis]|uniref:zinc finger protein ZFP2-like isoform X2 n=1 Tax=Leptidea sinapis TaxID=189913 RepID=UPI00213F1EE9|nr:zinc finger protein ZFP2-like isoform X2 [Leptidea sinapis]